MSSNHIAPSSPADAARDIPALLWLVGMDGRIRWLSKEMERSLRSGTADPIGQVWVDMLHPDDRSNWEKTFSAASKTRSSFAMEHRLGGERPCQWLMSQCSPSLDEEENLTGYAIITSRLDQPDSHPDGPESRMMDQLVHDVRNALAPISTGIAIVKNQFSTEKHARLFQIMEKQVGLIIDMVGGGHSHKEHKEKSAQSPASEGLSKRAIHHILVIDDNPNILEVLKEGLEDRGFSVDCSLDGEAGLQKALTGHYDACVCDLAIPKVNGLSVARAIRSHPGDMLLISMSGSDSEELQAHSKSAGFSTHLVKPISLEHIIRLIT